MTVSFKILYAVFYILLYHSGEVLSQILFHTVRLFSLQIRAYQCFLLVIDHDRMKERDPSVFECDPEQVAFEDIVID